MNAERHGGTDRIGLHARRGDVMQPAVRVTALFTGPAQPLARPGHPPVPSGIAKSAQVGPLRLYVTGFEGDEQGDRVYHGGPEKAVHHYPSEHYAMWRMRFPASPVTPAPGAFGENVSTTGMTEQDVCIGDTYRVGTALLQVSQGRQPCWKLNRRLDHPDAAFIVQQSGATGWYYRVLETGVLARGDRLDLLDRPCPDWPLARLIRALFPSDADPSSLRAEWRLAAALGPLSANWRQTFLRRVESGRIEDWGRRLTET